jgi:hypothetical protein
MEFTDEVDFLTGEPIQFNHPQQQQQQPLLDEYAEEYYTEQQYPDEWTQQQQYYAVDDNTAVASSGGGYYDEQYDTPTPADVDEYDQLQEEQEEEEDSTEQQQEEGGIDVQEDDAVVLYSKDERVKNQGKDRRVELSIVLDKADAVAKALDENADLCRLYSPQYLLERAIPSKLKIMKYAIEKGASVKARNVVQCLKLNSSLEVLNVLANSCQDLNDQVDGFSVLEHAILSENCEFISQLRDLGIDLNQMNARTNMTPIIFALLMGKYSSLLRLLDLGVDVNQKLHGNSVFHIINHLKGNESFNAELLINRLVELGADLEGKNALGLTPFLSAIYLERFDLLQFYVDRGCDIHALNFQGKDAFWVLFSSPFVSDHSLIINFLQNLGLELEETKFYSHEKAIKNLKELASSHSSSAYHAFKAKIESKSSDAL